MVAAGYDPQGAVELQETFLRLSEGRNQDWLSGLFASHPPSRERLQKNRELAASLPDGGELGEQRYQQQIAALKKSEKAYEYAALGREALQAGRLQEAERWGKHAVMIEPRESRFHGLMGDISLAQQRESLAERYYGQAIERDPEWFYFPLARGALRQRMNKTSGAREDLQRSLQLLPTGSGFYQLGVLEKRSGNRDLAVRYLQTAEQAGGEVAQRAAAELQTM
jgi:predicted Zn-dependent protease